MERNNHCGEEPPLKSLGKVSPQPPHKQRRMSNENGSVVPNYGSGRGRCGGHREVGENGRKGGGCECVITLVVSGRQRCAEAVSASARLRCNLEGEEREKAPSRRGKRRHLTNTEGSAILNVGGDGSEGDREVRGKTQNRWKSGLGRSTGDIKAVRGGGVPPKG